MGYEGHLTHSIAPFAIGAANEQPHLYIGASQKPKLRILRRKAHSSNLPS